VIPGDSFREVGSSYPFCLNLLRPGTDFLSGVSFADADFGASVMKTWSRVAAQVRRIWRRERAGDPSVSTLADDGLSPEHRPLERCERQARALLAQGDVVGAAELAQRLTTPTSASRLLTDVCRALAGRRIEAQLDLVDWSRRACCPMDARLLLALLQIEEGDRARAIASLNRNLAQIDDPRTIQAIILIQLERGDAAEASRWADRLRRLAINWTDRPAISGWLTSLGLEPGDASAEPPDTLVEQLALEVLACESTIVSLEAASRHDRSRPRALLLMRALESAFDRLEEPVPACEAMARLALTLGDTAGARRWIDTGLKLNPLCAPLAILLAELPALEDATRRQRDANAVAHVLPHRREQIEALEVVIAAHPEWNDVRNVKRRLEAA